MSISYRVYKNLFELVKYRKLRMTSGDLTELSGSNPEMLEENDLINVIQKEGYIMLGAEYTEKKVKKLIPGMHPSTVNLPTKTIFVLLNERSVHTSSANNFEKLLNKIPDINSSGNQFNMDILVITSDQQKSGITNKPGKFSHIGSESEGFVRITMHNYSMFTSNRMKNVAVSPAKILSQKNAKQIVRELNISKLNLPKMKVNSVVAVWLGAEVGDIVKEIMDSEATGQELKFMYVKS
jgi:DNA-directed RNA polymerase subunit H (RpoH/RPB5)